MTDKELQKLRRSDLIELLYYLSKENDALKAENQHMKERLDALVGKAIASMGETADLEQVDSEQEPRNTTKSPGSEEETETESAECTS